MNELSIKTQNEVIQTVEMETITEYLDSTGLTSRLNQNEKSMFINMARNFGLNPFKREIYCNVYGEGQYRQCSIVTGYEVYLKRAERIGKLDGWNCETRGSVSGGDLQATVIIWRKDWSHPFQHTVFYNEVCQTKKDGSVNKFWSKMPIFMTKKVAVAQAFRLCFSDEFGGMPYTSDEIGVEESNEINIGDLPIKVVSEHEQQKVSMETNFKSELGQVLQNYELALGDNFVTAKNVYINGNEEDAKKMLDRCVVYLTRVGAMQKGVVNG